MAGAPRRRVAVALGSNLGDRHAAFAFAIERLSRILTNPQASSAIDTDPEGPGLADQPMYLNAAVIGETDLSARDLLDALLQIEQEFGRERPLGNRPRPRGGRMLRSAPRARKLAPWPAGCAR